MKPPAELTIAEVEALVRERDRSADEAKAAFESFTRERAARLSAEERAARAEERVRVLTAAVELALRVMTQENKAVAPVPVRHFEVTFDDEDIAVLRAALSPTPPPAPREPAPTCIEEAARHFARVARSSKSQDEIDQARLDLYRAVDAPLTSLHSDICLSCGNPLPCARHHGEWGDR